MSGFWQCLTDNWRDVVNVVAVVATVAAAWLAWLAIRNGNRQAKSSADALVRERRIDFELDHLDRIGDALEKGDNVAFTGLTIQRGLALLPSGEMPRLRARYSPPSTQAAMAEDRAIWASGDPWNTVVQPEGITYREALKAEVRDAISRRLAERGDG